MPERDKLRRRRGLSALPPDAALGFSGQLGQLYGGFRDITGTLQTQRKQIKGQFGTQRAALARARQQGLEDVELGAMERGVLGGSGDLADRVRVRANVSTQLSEAMNARNQALLANRAQAQQALRDFRLGVISLEQAKAAQKSMGSVEDFINNAFGGGGGMGGGPGGGGPGGGGGGGQSPILQKMSKRIKGLVDSYTQAHSSRRVELKQQLLKLWRRRNKIRRDQGMNVIRRSRLDKLLAAAAGEDTNPGGQL